MRISQAKQHFLIVMCIMLLAIALATGPRGPQGHEAVTVYWCSLTVCGAVLAAGLTLTEKALRLLTSIAGPVLFAVLISLSIFYSCYWFGRCL